MIPQRLLLFSRNIIVSLTWLLLQGKTPNAKQGPTSRIANFFRRLLGNSSSLNRLRETVSGSPVATDFQTSQSQSFYFDQDRLARKIFSIFCALFFITNGKRAIYLGKVAVKSSPRSTAELLLLRTIFRGLW